MLLKNKIVLVTGSVSKGIGEAIALYCLAQGAKVMLHGIATEEEHAKELTAQYPAKAAYFIADFRDPNQYEQLILATVNQFGALHCLVNNAATTQRASLKEVTPKIFDDIFAINVKGPLFLIKAAIQQFEKQQTGGRILNIGSINAYCGQQDLLPYSMSKSALMNLTINLADTNALSQKGIFFNQLNLGWIASENELKLKLKEGWPPNWHEKIPKYIAPSGRLLSTNEVASHAVFWISDEAGPVTGTIVNLEQFPMTVRLNGNQSAFFNELRQASTEPPT